MLIPLAMSRSYSAFNVSRSYSGCPNTKKFCESMDFATYTPASSDTAMSSSPGCASMSAARTSVKREWGAKNSSSNPRTSGEVRLTTAWGNTPNIFSGSSCLGTP